MRWLRAGFVLSTLLAVSTASSREPVLVGFAARDITPPVGEGRKVYLAGFGVNRRAKGIHDRLYARSVVLAQGDKRLAIVSVDLVGLQYPAVKAVRAKLPNFSYVLVTSTHNHQGPDVIGIWGKGRFHRGADDAYIESVVSQIVESVRQAATNLKAATGFYGTAEDESLLADTRLPDCKDAVLRVLQFRNAVDSSPAGILVQWNCHPESLGPKNTQVTADFPWATIAALESRHQCPVVYVSGAVGGLMTHPPRLVESGQELEEGSFEYAEKYGRRIADLASKAMVSAEEVSLTPLAVHAKAVAIPVQNSLYRTASVLGVMHREAFVWNGDFQSLGSPMTLQTRQGESAIESEVGYLRIGDVHVACIPGEIYPELVYGRFENPPAAGVDFPDAPLEPTIAELMPTSKWLILGLANDELGYIIPKRQWDKSPPYAYGQDGGQYGEINSCSPQVAPIVMEALKMRVAEAQ